MQAQDFLEEVLEKAAGFELGEGWLRIAGEVVEDGGAEGGEDLGVQGEADEGPAEEGGGCVAAG